MTCLRAMQRAFYSIALVESVHRGVGVTVRDLVSNENFDVIDLGLGASARPGFAIASRFLPQEGFVMTGGAAVPLGTLPRPVQQSFAAEAAKVLAPGKDGVVDPAPLIRAGLKQGASRQIAYQDLPNEPAGRS